MALDHWDVQPAAARAVIRTARTHARDLQRKQTDLRTAIEDAAGTANSSLIAGALSDTWDNYLSRVAEVARLTALNVANKGDRIVDAFVHADDTMATTARRAIDDVPSSAQDAR